MKGFLFKTIFFALLLISLLAASLYLPPAKNLKNSILSAITDKENTIKNIKGPKIILLGGSNLSFGLNSQKLSESFNRPVINMGIHAGIGLRFTMNNARKYIGANDVVVVIPEYENFYSESFNGEIELVSAVLDICPESKSRLDAAQWLSLSHFVPVYAARKLKAFVTGLVSSEEETVSGDVYGRSSFNRFGDAIVHWNLPDRDFSSHPVRNKVELKKEAFDFVSEFKDFVALKQARLILLPPVIEERSYKNLQPEINLIEEEFATRGFPFSSAPQMYAYPKKYFFNSYYHLNKKGVDIRTAQLINDLKNASGS